MRFRTFLSNLLKPLFRTPEELEAKTCAIEPASSSCPSIPPVSFPIPPQDSRIQPLCDDLRRQGRLLPAWEAMGMRLFMERIAAAQSEEMDCLQWFQRFLESLPPSIEFAESAPDASVSFTADPVAGGRVDGHSVSRHRRAMQLISLESGLSYSEALRRISH